MIVRIGAKRKATPEEKKNAKISNLFQTNKQTWIDEETIYEYVELAIQSDEPIIQMVYDQGKCEGETHEFHIRDLVEREKNYVVDTKMFDYVPASVSMELGTEDIEEIKEETELIIHEEMLSLDEKQRERFNLQEIKRNLFKKTALI